jgi:hypothetical protein
MIDASLADNGGNVTQSAVKNCMVLCPILFLFLAIVEFMFVFEDTEV